MARKYGILHSAAKGLARSSTRAAIGGTEKTAKWLASDPFGNVEFSIRGSRIMELQQR